MLLKYSFKYVFILLAVVFFICTIHAQKTLQILKIKPGSFKKYELFCGSKLVYKLKGDHFYRHQTIANMNDSIILFENDSLIKLSEIKTIKLKVGNHLMGTFAEGCWKGAVLWPALNFVNNMILESAFRVDPRALYISGGFALGFVIFKELSVKRIHMNRNVTLKVLDLDFQKLNK